MDGILQQGLRWRGIVGLLALVVIVALMVGSCPRRASEGTVVRRDLLEIQPAAGVTYRTWTVVPATRRADNEWHVRFTHRDLPGGEIVIREMQRLRSADPRRVAENHLDVERRFRRDLPDGSEASGPDGWVTVGNAEVFGRRFRLPDGGEAIIGATFTSERLLALLIRVPNPKNDRERAGLEALRITVESLRVR